MTAPTVASFTPDYTLMETDEAIRYLIEHVSRLERQVAVILAIIDSYDDADAKIKALA